MSVSAASQALTEPSHPVDPRVYGLAIRRMDARWRLHSTPPAIS